MITAVTPSPADPDRYFFSFDAAAPGGRGGASVKLSPGDGLASIDGVHKNSLLPPRSTGALLADGLAQTSLPRPLVVEGYNVEPATAAALAAGGTGPGTPVGNLLADTAHALGGAVTRWEPIRDGNAWHLRIYISYPGP